METKTIHERLYELRKSLNIRQGDFAKTLGLTNAAVSMIENGKNPLTESNLRLICLTFNVRYEWLRTGEGDMFDFTNNDPLIKEVIELMKKMNEAERQVVLNYVRWFASEQRTLAGKETPPPESGCAATTSVKRPDVTIKKRAGGAEGGGGGAGG